MEAPIDLTDDPASGVDDAVDLRGLSNDDMDDESLDVAIARCREDLEECESEIRALERRRRAAAAELDALVKRREERAGARAGDRAAEADMIAKGWEAQAWGITYQIVEKPMDASVHPDAFKAAMKARGALETAVAEYPTVRAAVEQARAGRE